MQIVATRAQKLVGSPVLKVNTINLLIKSVDLLNPVLAECSRMTRTMDIVTSVTAESEFAATDNFFNVMTSESNCNLTALTEYIRSVTQDDQLIRDTAHAKITLFPIL